MLGIVAAAGDAVPRRLRSELDRALAEGAQPDKRLPELVRMEREVTLGDRDRLRPPLPAAPAPARDRAVPPGAERQDVGARHARAVVGAPASGPPGAGRPIRARHQAALSCALSSPTLKGCGRDGPDRSRRARRTASSTKSREVVLGKREALELLMLGLLADGHVLIEDYPGLAKTLMARSFAQVDVDGLLAHPVHAGPDALRRDGLVGVQPAEVRLRVPARARSSPTSCSPTRSTAPRRRRRPRCSRRCRSGR